MTHSSQAVTLDSWIVISDDVMAQEVGGELVLLDMATEHYFRLDAIGVRVWQLIKQHEFLRDVQAHLCSEFHEEPRRISNDLLTLAQSLLDAGLAHHRC